MGPFVAGLRGLGVFQAAIGFWEEHKAKGNIESFRVGITEVGPLADQPSSAEYDSVHLRAKDQPETYDVALGGTGEALLPQA